MTFASRLSPADVSVARALPLFSGLRSEQVAELIRPAVGRTVIDDSLLFSAGDPADRFFIVVSGAVRLFMLNASGIETVIDIIEGGESFAEVAMFGSGRFPLYGEAMAGTRLITLEAQPFLRRLCSNNELGFAMLSALGRWEMRLLAELRQLKSLTPAQRLAWYLLRLAQATEGPARIKLPYRKAIIAARIGITPESFSRALARLAHWGVQTQGDEVDIADAAKLERFCRG
jgi:CRP-like cAMP-binding protein